METIQFQIPIHPEDLLVDNGVYSIENTLDSESLSEKASTKILEEISLRIRKENAADIIHHENFDPIFCFVQKFSALDPSAAEHIFEILKSGLSCVVSSSSELLNNAPSTEELDISRNAIKMYIFLLHWFLSQAKQASPKPAPTKGKGRGRKATKKDSESSSTWQTETQKEAILSIMIHTLELDLSRLWKMTYPEDEFLSLFATTAYSMLEDPANAKSKVIKRCLFLLISILVKKYNQAPGVVNSLINMLHKFEHLPPHIAELMEVMVNEFKCTQIVGDIIREIARMNPKEARDNCGVKNISLFLAALGERVPRHVLPNISVLLPHLNGESYMMRNGIIQLIGFLVAKGFAEEDKKTEDSEARDDLLNILGERFRDVNSFTRNRVIQTWQYLIQERVPLERARITSTTTSTIDRLRDRTAAPRKSAIQLLTTLLEYNPFGPTLKLANYTTEVEKLEKVVPKDVSADESGEEHENPKERENRSLLQFYREAVEFIRQMQDAVPTLCQLLGSNNSSDVLEGIQFFITATRFNLENAIVGVRKMLMLIWAKEGAIKEAVINAYRHLYLEGEENKDPARIAKNLINLTIKASLGELTSLEELMFELMKKGYIDSAVIQILWEIFAMRYGNITKKTVIHSRGALIILSMLGAADPEIIRNKLNLLVQVGLGPRWKEDEFLARYTCVALQKLAAVQGSSHKEKSADGQQQQPDKKPNEPTFRRLKSSHAIFQKLAEIIKDRTVPITKWFPAAEQAINTIYVLNEKPDSCCEGIIKEWIEILFPSFISSAAKTDMETELHNCSAFDLSKFFFILGHVALKQLTRIQLHLHHLYHLADIEEIQNELRRRREGSTKTTKTKKQKKDQEPIEAELGVAAAAEENEVEVLQLRAEKEIVGKNLLGAFGPVIDLVCANAGNKFNDHTLRTSAVMALTKYMCVSSEFCDKHLQLLFTILQTAPEPAIRSNIVIALGDLAFRFPNLIERWTPTVYGILRDKDPRVRKNTLMVLSHLILNDMIKVKGQISEMAICIEDEDTRIADLARLFFHEFAQKANTIYNILPDLISSISSSSSIKQDSFQSIMKYLFSFIEKDKQAESLVEKLCHRFRTAKEQEWKNIAYCLSLLNYNDKSLKKLIEFHKLYQDKLGDDEILSAFATIISKTKKFAKQEVKEALAELESKINLSGAPADDNNEKANDNETSKPATTKARGKPSQRGRGRGRRGAARGKPKAPRGRGKGKKAYSSDEEEEEEEDSPTQVSSSSSSSGEERSPSPPPKKKKPRVPSDKEDEPPKAPTKKVTEEDQDVSGEEEEEEEPAAPKQPTKKTPPKNSNKKRVIVSESESEPDEEEADQSGSASDT